MRDGSTTSARARAHIRSNAVGYVAVFLALSGTAAALPGANTVDSGDIINGEVRSRDVANGELGVADLGIGSVRSGEVANGELGVADLGIGSVRSGEVANGELGAPDLGVGSVRSGEVANHSLRAADLAPGSVTPSELASVPAVSVRHSATQMVPPLTGVTLQFDTEDYDTANMHDGLNPSRLVAPIDGIYLVTGSFVRWTTGSTEWARSLSIRRTQPDISFGIVASTSEPVPTGGFVGNHQDVTTQVELDAGGYVELEAAQNASADKFVQPGSRFSMTWIAPAP